jgi:hypothetical protein
MSFQPVSLHSIRSSNQRALAAHWNALAAHRLFPAIEEFSPNPKDHNPGQLIVWDVERTDGDSGYRFRARQLGERAMEAIGNRLVAGKTMDEVAPPALREISLDGARECAASGCAVFTIITTIAANGLQVDCERLLLPFGGDDGAVQHIVAALQLISFQGTVERQNVTQDFEVRSYVSFAGRIGSDGAARKATAAVPSPPLQPAQPSPPQRAQDATGPDKHAPVDSRSPARRKGLKTGRIGFGKSTAVVTVRDMSPTDASIELDDPSIVPDTFTLVLEMESAKRRCAVVWRKDRQIGVRFG